ncbi:MAG TPA: hypothetical protein VGI03_00240 [Verrucomicrobiae bacterium]|jgi:hypothetical protein
MKDLLAFILPPAIALCGMRIHRLLLGKGFEDRFGAGLRWALGLAVGMLIFTQAALAGALAGFNLAGPLAYSALLWGGVEICLMFPPAVAQLKQFKFQLQQLWLLLLLPVLFYCWVFGRLSTLEGTLEFDANAFWVFKAKVLYLEQGSHLLYWMRQPGLAYAHWDYPLLVPCLYCLDYGVVGGVDEFVNKVWPFWMVVALCVGVLSLAKVWQRPHPLPVLAVIIFCFLPATLDFIRREGGTMPMVFFVSLAVMLLITAIVRADELYLAAGMLTAVGAAMSKFEGIIFLAVWFCVMLAICRRRSWLKKHTLRWSALICLLSVLPYLWFRLEKPIAHPESNWWRDGFAAPAATFHRFSQVLFLNCGGRFFSSDFFQWQPDAHDHLSWTGKWTGLDIFLNGQLSILPWLLLLVLTMVFWKKSTRLAATALCVVIIGVLSILAFTISCLPAAQNNLSFIIQFSSSDEVGRYSYPFFIAWFLGLILLWCETLEPASLNTPAKSAQGSISAPRGGLK